MAATKHDTDGDHVSSDVTSSAASKSARQTAKRSISILTQRTAKKPISKSARQTTKKSISIGSDTEQFELTPTVVSALQSFGGKSISAAEFAVAIFARHDEYAHGKAVSLTLTPTGPTRPARDWIDEVDGLFDPTKIADLNGTALSPEMHGQLLIVGLCLLEPGLRQQLTQAGVFDDLKNEIREGFLDIVTDRGRTLYFGRVDKVPNWPDDPVEKLERDLLGRGAFARYLAERIRSIPRDSNAYAFHLYGPWGAGKTTVMNFLKQALENQEDSGKTDRERWLVVEFNAWQNQHMRPAWWPLLEKVYQTAKQGLTLSASISEIMWRANSGNPFIVVAVIAVGLITAFAIVPFVFTLAPVTALLGTWAETADNVAKILSLLGTFWGVIAVLSRSLLVGSTRAAKLYMESTRDPTGEIESHFRTLINKHISKRVVIFIDDLDRCQSSYVVELLEGIQTLFSNAHVVFVVAADRRWLNACYIEMYEKFEPQVGEPGKPLGALFLEKAFRFSTPLPGMSGGLRREYWRYLLQMKPDDVKVDLREARREAKSDARGVKSDGHAQGLVDVASGKDFLEQRVIREEVAVRLAAPEVMENLEHTLRPYLEFLEPNPRAMKRLVNSYSANRALALLSEVDIDIHQLALWTILSSRWPQLADHLTEHPEDLSKIGHQDRVADDNGLKPLFDDPEVKHVVAGGSSSTPLIADTVSRCAQTHA